MSIEKNNKKQRAKDPYSIAEMKKQWEFITNEEGICLTRYKGNDKELFIPERIGKTSVTRIGNNALIGRDIVIVTIPESVTHIGEDAFSRCNKLSTVWISSSVVHIAGSAFVDCPKLTAFEIDSKNGVYSFTNGCLIENGDTLVWGQKDSEIPEGITRIGDHAFSECKGLSTVSIPDSVTTIGKWAFSNCAGLSKITMPEKLASIGEYTLYGCNKLSFNKNNNAKYLGSAQNPFLVLYSAATERITSCKVHPDTRFIMRDAFLGCLQMKSITIPAGVESIDEGAGLPPAIINIEIDPENKVYSYIDHCLIENGDTVIWGGNNCVIPADGSIRTIKRRSFAFLKELSSIIIPPGVITIGEAAFLKCDNLTQIVFPESLTSIGESAFRGCSKLKAVSIPDSVSKIGKNAFMACSRMESVVLSESLTEIPASAFEGCRNLREVIIPDNVTRIGACAFSECEKLASVVISENVERIDYWAFRGCKALCSVTFLNPDTKIDASAFVKLDGVVIKAPAGSTAEQYAIRKKAVFQDIDSEENGYDSTKEIVIEANKKTGKKPICQEGEYIVRYRFLNSMSLKWSVWQYREDVFESVEDAMNLGVAYINMPDTCFEGEAEIIDHTGKAVAFSGIC